MRNIRHTTTVLSLFLFCLTINAQVYPEAGDYIGHAQYDWLDETGEWIDSNYYSVPTYIDGFKTEQYSYTRNSSDQWYQSGYSAFFYTGEDLMSKEYYFLNELGDTIGNYRQRYTYENDLTTFYAFDELESGVWTTSFEMHWVLNEDGNYLKNLIYFWDASQQALSMTDSIHYLYDIDGLLDSVISFNYDVQSGGWLRISADDYAYYSNDVLASLETFEYIGGNPVPSNLSEYSYNANGEVDQVDYYYYVGGYFPSTRESYSYDSQNRMITMERYGYDLASGDYTDVASWTEYLYQESELVEIGSYAWNRNTPTPYVSGTYRYTYAYNTPVPEGIMYHQPNQIGVYPNPASDQISFISNDQSNIESIGIYDLLGNRVLQMNQVQTSAHTAFISDLATGQYIYQVQSEGGKIMTGKFVKRN